jgi:hypothetical protein
MVQITITGTVEYSQFTSGPLEPVDPGQPASMSFLVDSDNFVNSPSFPTRGYPIDQTSFTMTMGSVTIALENPYPAGQTPYFVLRNNDPAVDGFLISENVDFPFNVDMSVPNVNLSFLATYTSGSTIPSLNILDALGSYSLKGISSFQWTLDVGPANPMGMIYESMTISRLGAPCPADVDGNGSVDADDLVAVVLAWGTCADPQDCPGDADGNGNVDADDLVMVILAWGECP